MHEGPELRWWHGDHRKSKQESYKVTRTHQSAHQGSFELGDVETLDATTA